MDLNPHELKFSRDDCVVVRPQIDRGSEGKTSRARYGQLNGSASIDGRIATPEELNKVTVIHGGTNLSFTESRFMPHRNKELAFQGLEKLVNLRLEEMRKIYDAEMAKRKSSNKEG